MITFTEFLFSPETRSNVYGDPVYNLMTMFKQDVSWKVTMDSLLEVQQHVYNHILGYARAETETLFETAQKGVFQVHHWVEWRARMLEVSQNLPDRLASATYAVSLAWGDYQKHIQSGEKHVDGNNI